MTGLPPSIARCWMVVTAAERSPGLVHPPSASGGPALGPIPFPDGDRPGGPVRWEPENRLRPSHVTCPRVLTGAGVAQVGRACLAFASSRGGELRVLTYNILDGGVDRDGTSRLELISELVGDLDPDVVALQEANDFERDGQRRRFEFERATGMRSFLGRSVSGYHGALLVKPGFRVVTWQSETSETNRSFNEMTLVTPGGARLGVVGVHLHPFSPDARLFWALHAMPGPPAIVLGDFNTPRADDPGVDAAVSRIGPRLLARSGNIGTEIDDRAPRAMERAGFVDLYRRAHPGEPGVTMQRLGVRLDYIFATEDLADRLGDCQVYGSTRAEAASDHLPLFADLDIA